MDFPTTTFPKIDFKNQLHPQPTFPQPPQGFSFQNGTHHQAPQGISFIFPTNHGVLGLGGVENGCKFDAILTLEDEMRKLKHEIYSIVQSQAAYIQEIRELKSQLKDVQDRFATAMDFFQNFKPNVVPKEEQ